MKLKRVTINLKKEIDHSYKILIKSNIFTELANDLRKRPLGKKYAIITDSTVRRLYGEKLIKALHNYGLNISLFNFPAGEESKTVNIIEYLTNQIVNQGLTRKSAIIALGGGVVGDVAGFIAATYMRGIPYIQIPTTLLAQVDSSVGGKTAVNTSEGKNLIGVFNQPKGVYIDPAFLLTLPEREIRNGIAEIIKYGVIYDVDLFEYLEKNVNHIKQLNISTLTYIIFRACQIKAEIVQKDEKEENLRSILNYGHTLAHAIEKYDRFTGYLHGEAVSIGMNYAGSLAHVLNFWTTADVDRQRQLITSFKLPLKAQFNPTALIKTMRHDKKVESDNITFVLPQNIGRMATENGKYTIPISKDKLMLVFSLLAQQNPNN